MDKVTYTTVETVATFTFAEVCALLLREAGMPANSELQAHKGLDGNVYQFTITHRREGDDRPRASVSETPAAPHVMHNVHRVGGQDYTYPDALPIGYRWALDSTTDTFWPVPVPVPADELPPGIRAPAWAGEQRAADPGYLAAKYVKD